MRLRSWPSSILLGVPSPAMLMLLMGEAMPPGAGVSIANCCCSISSNCNSASDPVEQSKTQWKRDLTRKSHAHLLYTLNLSHHVLSPHGA